MLVVNHSQFWDESAEVPSTRDGTRHSEYALYGPMSYRGILASKTVMSGGTPSSGDGMQARHRGRGR